MLLDDHLTASLSWIPFQMESLKLGNSYTELRRSLHRPPRRKNNPPIIPGARRLWSSASAADLELWPSELRRGETAPVITVGNFHTSPVRWIIGCCDLLLSSWLLSDRQMRWSVTGATRRGSALTRGLIRISDNCPQNKTILPQMICAIKSELFESRQH